MKIIFFKIVFRAVYQTFYKFENISEYQSVIESSAMFHTPSFFTNCTVPPLKKFLAIVLRGVAKVSSWGGRELEIYQLKIRNLPTQNQKN